MGSASNKIIKIGLLTNPDKTIGNVVRCLNSRSDVILICKADNVNKFLAKGAYLTTLDLIIILEQPGDGGDHSPIHQLRKTYPYANLLYLSNNEHIAHITWAIESGINAYITPSYINQFLQNHLHYFMEEGSLFLPPLLQLKIMLYYYPLSEGHFLDLNLSEREVRVLHMLQEGLSINEISLMESKKTLKPVKLMIESLCKKIDLGDSVSIV